MLKANVHGQPRQRAKGIRYQTLKSLFTQDRGPGKLGMRMEKLGQEKRWVTDPKDP